MNTAQWEWNGIEFETVERTVGSSIYGESIAYGLTTDDREFMVAQRYADFIQTTTVSKGKFLPEAGSIPALTADRAKLEANYRAWKELPRSFWAAYQGARRRAEPVGNDPALIGEADPKNSRAPK